MVADSIFSVAPGEGHKPIGILTDEHFEEMCNPTKYPRGKFGLMSNRKVKLTVCKYFNQRLLDADGRFAKDVEYLLTAHMLLRASKLLMMPVLCYGKLREDCTRDKRSQQVLSRTSK